MILTFSKYAFKMTLPAVISSLEYSQDVTVQGALVGSMLYNVNINHVIFILNIEYLITARN